MPHLSTPTADEALRIELRESLDASAADRVRTLLASPPAQREVVLDFTRVRHVDWHALAALTRALAAAPARVTLRGLCDHHLKVLRYLEAGAPLPSDRRRTAGEPEVRV